MHRLRDPLVAVLAAAATVALVACGGSGGTREDGGRFGDASSPDGTIVLEDASATDGSGSDAAAPAGSIMDIAVGERHGCAVTRAGELFCWGANHRGQLGDGTMTDRPVPTRVTGLDGVVQVAVADADADGPFPPCRLPFTCALVSDGRVACWGANECGQLGYFTDGSDSLAPRYVDDVAGAVEIGIGEEHSCALVRRPIEGDGMDAGGAVASEVLCWGRDFGRPSPLVAYPLADVRDAAAIAVGFGFTCVLRGSGSVVCFGYGDLGQLGNGTSTATFSTSPVEVTGLSRAVAVHAGRDIACASLEDGSLGCWGFRYRFSRDFEDFRARVIQAPFEVAGLAGVVDAALNDSPIAVLGTGSAIPFGFEARDPDLLALPPIAEFDTGAVYLLGCVRTVDGRVFCVGDNDRGQLGAGHTDRVADWTEVVVP